MSNSNPKTFLQGRRKKQKHSSLTPAFNCDISYLYEITSNEEGSTIKVKIIHIWKTTTTLMDSSSKGENINMLLMDEKRQGGKRGKHTVNIRKSMNTTTDQINMISMFSLFCRLDIEDSDSENELIPTENMNLTDDKNKKRLEVEDSDCEDEQKNNENVEGKSTDPTATKKKRQYIEVTLLQLEHLTRRIKDTHQVLLLDAPPDLNKMFCSKDCLQMTMSDYFHMPIALAANRLNVSLTVFKKQCRQVGIERWPYPKLKSLHNMITDFQDQRGGAETYGNIEEIIAQLKEEIKQIRQNPNLPIANFTRRLRQRYFKVKHRERKRKKESINLDLTLACTTSANVEPLQVIYPSNYSRNEEIYDGFVSDSDEQEHEKDA
ncbi:protein RKD1 [Artemisia annua]|uniref:Protein RKD1 n=1 Tax=Artemisia annua TaxID=35608 RepID=A0A2U1P1X5_ARTAN|nr:protein RKD1 [Artemisia annua]